MRRLIKEFVSRRRIFGYYFCKVTPVIFGVFTVSSVFAQQLDLDRVGGFHEPAAKHCTQEELLAVTDPHERFEEAFECGDVLFETRFNALDGVGANVGDGQRFTRVPRADKTGPTEWANHFPERATGPNAEACNICHSQPSDDGAGPVGVNNIRDPQHTANPGQFINRSVPHLFGAGALQLLAEEMTADLQAIRDDAIEKVNRGGGEASGVSCSIVKSATKDRHYRVKVEVTNNGSTPTNGWSVTLSFTHNTHIHRFWNVLISDGDTNSVTASNTDLNAVIEPGAGVTFGITGKWHSEDTFTPPTCEGSGNGGGSVTLELVSKSVSFGSITANANGSVNTSRVVGVDDDLVITPFAWKGDNFTVRDFNRGASHNELGMQAVELTGDNIDGDGDGVVNELGIGDESALAVYIASQPRPVTTLELNDLGLLETPLTGAQIDAIEQGSNTFSQVGCADCHRPSLTVNNPIFSEPSRYATHRDAVFPAGQDPISRGVDPANPISFNLTTDQPDNIIEFNGQEIHLGSFEANDRGGAIIRLYGDLKRHDMGPGLAESIDETGVGASVFITKELWGVGSTGPYLHDGRATTLTEAILLHGGEAQASRDATDALSDAEFNNLLAFLDSLVLFKQEE